MRDDYLPVLARLLRAGDAYGFWAAIERETRTRSSAGSTCDRCRRTRRTNRSSGTGWSGRRGASGYATEGSRALVDKAFAELGARRVHASTMAVNTGSRRVMEKAGLRFVRTFVADWPVRIEGDEDGDVEYAITREEWVAARTPPG